MPAAAKDAIKSVALNSHSPLFQSVAKDLLSGAGVDVTGEILDQAANGNGQASDIYDTSSPGPLGQDLRSYTKEQIEEPIPPDANHEYPSELEYLVPVSLAGSTITDAPFLVTVHSETDGADRVAAWKRIGPDRYRRLFVNVWQDLDEGAHLEVPTVFSSTVTVTGNNADHQETGVFIDLPLHRYTGDWDGIYDSVFAVSDGGLQPVEIEPADRWYDKQFRVSNPFEDPVQNSFSNNNLQFVFHIWGGCHACAGGANVNGNYKMVKEISYDKQNKDWVTTWKMLVVRAVRTPEKH
ncbi:MAG: hypothetical protein ACLQBA_01545 [Candidatus Binataceae bacterium]